MSDEEVDEIFHAMLMAEWELVKNQHLSDEMSAEEREMRNSQWN